MFCVAVKMFVFNSSKNPQMSVFQQNNVSVCEECPFFNYLLIFGCFCLIHMWF